MSFEQPPFDEIEWRISGEEALVAIDAFEDGIVIDDNFLVSAEAMLATGIEKFILEKAISSEDKND